MKNIVKSLVLFVLVFFVITGCNGTPKSGDEIDSNLNVDLIQGNFTDVQNKDWLLVELRIDGTDIGFNRSALAEEGFAEMYTLSFIEDRLSGVGAPNRFFAQYSLKDGNNISISAIAGTLMATFLEPEKLKEHEFFGWLQNAYKWRLSGDNFELFSKADNGAEAIMVFSAKL